MKRCPNCKKPKDLSEFSRDSHKKSGRCSWCKKCIKTKKEINKEKIKAYIDQYYQNNKERIGFLQKERNKCNPEVRKDVARRARLKYGYNITIEDYNTLFSKQEGRCAICGRHQSEFVKAFAVDHNHETGKIRGLLCLNCNVGIGMFKDSGELLIKATKYLAEE